MFNLLRKLGVITALTLALLIPIAAVTAQDSTATPSATVTEESTAAPIPPVELRVMTFNVWRGGELVDFSKVIEAIQAAKADIVGLQEGEANTRRIATALGWQYASERTQVISRFPIIDPPDANGRYVFVQINPGQVVAIANVHLPSDPYGPYDVRDGQTVDYVIEQEKSVRLPAIQAELDVLPGLVKAGIPVFITGDFNSPSYRDWTAPMIESRPQVKYAVEWPVSKAVEDAGFTDTYRTVYPDPTARFGITWTYGYPFPRLKTDESVDRIDFVFAAGNVDVLNSQIVGPTGSADADIGIQPYPSDHRAVVSTVRVTPGEPPIFAAVEQRRVAVGDPIVVRYHTPDGEDIDRIGILPADSTDSSQPLMWLPPYEASFFGAVTFGSGTLKPGQYAAVLLGVDQKELSRSIFWVVDPNAVPTMSTDKSVYRQGEVIEVSWQNTPGLKWDWVGVYAAGDADLYGGYFGYVYTDASVTGTKTIDASVLGDDMLPPGQYEVRLEKDDGNQVLAVASFTVAS